jgi:ketose-bisphosphate aldolase
MKTPVILMIYPAMKTIMPYSTFAAVTRDLASKVDVKVGLMLDHGPSFEDAMEAVAGGFSSIMIDYSHLEFEENIRLTKEVVRACHGLGIDVEGELGRVGVAANEEDYTNTDYYTRADKAAEYVERTGVDALAVAIGTAHGNYISEPKLDLDRLMEINRAVDIPLVLHGGTGVPEEQIRQAVLLGINKLNLATGYNLKMYDVYKRIIEEQKSRPRMTDLILAAEEDIKVYLRKAMRMVHPEAGREYA